MFFSRSGHISKPTVSCIIAYPDAVLEAEQSKREKAVPLGTIFPAINNFLPLHPAEHQLLPALESVLQHRNAAYKTLPTQSFYNTSSCAGVALVRFKSWMGGYGQCLSPTEAPFWGTEMEGKQHKGLHEYSSAETFILSTGSTDHQR